MSLDTRTSRKNEITDSDYPDICDICGGTAEVFYNMVCEKCYQDVHQDGLDVFKEFFDKLEVHK